MNGSNSLSTITFALAFVLAGVATLDGNGSVAIVWCALAIVWLARSLRRWRELDAASANPARERPAVSVVLLGVALALLIAVLVRG